MKGRLTLITGAIILVFNTIIGFLFNPIETTNIIVSDAVIVVYMALFFAINCFINNDAFSISLKSLFGIGALVCFILSYIVNEPVRDDYSLIAIIILTGINLLLFAIVHYVQSKNY